MIGHVFATSGATCLALAPSAERPDEYIVLARTENGYAVANVLTEKMTPAPDYWMRADYFDANGGDEADLWTAAVAFADQTWGGMVKALDDKALTEQMETLVAHVRHAEQVVEHRAHLAGA